MSGSKNSTLLALASEEGGTLRISAISSEILEIRTTALVASQINTSNLDRQSAQMIRDAIDRWLGK